MLFSDAFKAVTERDDFAEISKARLGIYEQVTGDAANLKRRWVPMLMTHHLSLSKAG